MKFTRRNTGWIGVDIGSSSLKIVQVKHSKSGWQVAASAVVPRQQPWLGDADAANKAASSLDEMKAARSLQDGFQGRKVAAALPMAYCDIHRIESDLEQDSKALQTLRQTIETALQQSADDLQCDYWSARGVEGKPGWTQALTVPRGLTERVCEDVAQAGWSCEAIDGLPLVMARAVKMVQPKATTAPLAVLDWGSSRATLCLIEDGQPAYVRCLKNGGLNYLLKKLVVELGVTDVEAQRLLEEYGLTSTAAGDQSKIARLLREIISKPISQIKAEIDRSISHYQYLRRASKPERMYLLGGGGMIRDIDSYLTAQLNIETKKWQLESHGQDRVSRDNSADCLLAPAIALSALAWEAS